MSAFKVKDIMTESPFMAEPEESIRDVAKRMREVDCGVLPVGSPEEVVGIITDRDIVLRVVAEGKDPAKTHVRDVMTKRVHCCEENDSLCDAAEEMRKRDVARLVVTRGKKATGIITMRGLLESRGDLAQSQEVLCALAGKRGHKEGAAREKAAV
jgi:CBS domain-containing protein